MEKKDRTVIHLSVDQVATSNSETRSGPNGKRWRRNAILAIKLAHSMIFLSVAASVLHIFYAGITNRRSRLTRVALGAALAESLVFTVNRFSCPLRTLTESLGAESGQVTDIFLPRWFADRIPLLFTPPLVIGILAMLWNNRLHMNISSGSCRM